MDKIASKQDIITVAVVDDHKLVRDMLAHMLSDQPDIRIVGQVGTIDDARAAIAELSPQIVLLDVAMPDGSGVEFAREIKNTRPETKIIFLTGHDSESLAITAIGTGAEGYLVKDNSFVRLLHAMRSVASGDYVFDSSVVTSIVRKFTELYPSEDAISGHVKLRNLSAKERRIAALVAQGMTNKEIAALTFVTINTVKTHLRRMFNQLGISSRRELVQLVKSRDIVGGSKD